MTLWDWMDRHMVAGAVLMLLAFITACEWAKAFAVRGGK